MIDKAKEIAKLITEEAKCFEDIIEIIRPHLPKELTSLPTDDGTDEWYCVWYKCPLCGKTWIVNFFNFCPCCGAKINWELPK